MYLGPISAPIIAAVVDLAPPPPPFSDESMNHSVRPPEMPRRAKLHACQKMVTAASLPPSTSRRCCSTDQPRPSGPISVLS